MSQRKILIGLAMSGAVAFLAAYVPSQVARAQAPKPAAAPPAGAAAGAAGAGGAATPTNCKLHGKKCCDPAVTAHLPKDAVFKACGESDATYVGEDGGSKETCKYFFKVPDAKEDETFVQVYAPAQKEVMQSPNDPFFSWKKVGKAYMTDKAKSPKAAPMAAAATGLYLPGKGYSVSINASTKVCTKQEAAKLAPSMK
jgi:hypothetical protein